MKAIMVYVLMFKEVARVIGEDKFTKEVIPANVVDVYPTYEKAEDSIKTHLGGSTDYEKDFLCYKTKVKRLPGTTNMESYGKFWIEQRAMLLEDK